MPVSDLMSIPIFEVRHTHHQIHCSISRDQYYKTIFDIIQNYGKILMHCMRCSVSFQVYIFVLATKD